LHTTDYLAISLFQTNPLSFVDIIGKQLVWYNLVCEDS
jgi:hypothetical protein